MKLDHLRADVEGDRLQLVELSSDGSSWSDTYKIFARRGDTYILESSDRYIRMRVRGDGSVGGWAAVPKEYADADFMRLE